MLLLTLGIALLACRREPEADPETSEAALRASGDESRRRMEVVNRVRLTLQDAVAFPFNSAVLRRDAERSLRAKVPLLRADSTIRLRIEGHTDERGSAEYNLGLGLRRAHAAMRYLTAAGVPANRLEADTFGESRPLDRGHSQGAWAVNRRVEFRIMSGPASAEWSH